MTNALTTFRPGLLGSRVFEDVFDNVDFPKYMLQTTQGYPVADIYRDDNGNTVMEFALAGFNKDQLSINIRPDKRSITVSANSSEDENSQNVRRIARRNFTKTYVNYDNNLDLSEAKASFENGLLSVVVPPRAELQPVSISIS